MNKILKVGDLVKYHNETPELNAMGFILGRLYQIERLMGTGLLVIKSVPNRALTIVDGETLTDAADHFSKHQCPIVLPRGL